MNRPKKVFNRTGGRSNPATKAELDRLQAQAPKPYSRLELRPDGMTEYCVHLDLEYRRMQRIREIQTKLSAGHEKLQRHYKRSAGRGR